MFVPSPEAFADLARSERVRGGFTQQELASRIGMSRRWVQDLEAGKLVPSLEAAFRVSAAFGYEFHLEHAEASKLIDSLFGPS